MKAIYPSYEILRPQKLDEASKLAIYKAIERAGRNCYRSEWKMTDDSAARFVKNMVRNGHHAMLEFADMTVLFTADRGITHELVRHRVASYAQESTRYCNYRKFSEVKFICPSEIFTGEHKAELLEEWAQACTEAEQHYLKMLMLGATPEQARTVLNTSLASNIVIKANMREWRHIFELRALGISGKPHPQMREIMVPLLKEVAEFMPELFGDIWTRCEQRLKEEKSEL